MNTKNPTFQGINLILNITQEFYYFNSDCFKYYMVNLQHIIDYV